MLKIKFQFKQFSFNVIQLQENYNKKLKHF